MAMEMLLHHAAMPKRQSLLLRCVLMLATPFQKLENFFVKLKDGTLNGSETILQQIADQLELVLLDSKFVVVTDPKGI